MTLPPNRMGTTWLDAGQCAVCCRDWTAGSIPVPTVYTEASIAADDPPQPICDYCVEEHDHDLFAALLADRERFWAS